MSKQFNTDRIVAVMNGTHAIAATFNHEYVTLEHLLYVLISDQEVKSALTSLGANLDTIRQECEDFFNSSFMPVRRHNHVPPIETATLGEVVQAGLAHAMFSNQPEARPAELILGILVQEGSHACTYLQNEGITALALKEFLSHSGGSAARQQGGQQGGEAPKDVNSKEDAIAYLEKFTTNLNETALKGTIDPLIGRQDEVDLIVQISARRTKNNAVLVGEPGVGKTAIAEGLALKIARGEVPEAISQSVVYSLDLGRLIAGTKFRGDFEERMSLILKSLTFMDQPILFIDEIHMIMGAGSGSNQSSMDVSNLLKPALQKGKLRCIGSTTHEEFRKNFEKDRALLRRFQKVDVLEPSIEDAKLIMRGLRATYEEFHGCSYTDEAIDAAVELTARYVNNRQLPDKAIDVIDGAGARQRVAPAETRITTITAEMIEHEVAKIARIPAKTVGGDERTKLKQLDVDLRGAVFGQNEAIDALTDAVYIARAGLRSDNKPAGTFLFVGPTGVGKTEMAKQLASTLGVPLVRFNMSEFMEKHSVSKLIGSPPGYVGHGEGGAGSGLLINAIDEKPHCVLLLDEMEKAHPDVFNLFLQVYDEGQLTSSNGKDVYFKNVTIIMSSNVGARREQQAALGFTKSDRVGEGDIDLKATFAPEFINRLDAVVRFRSLERASMESVVDKFFKELKDHAARSNVTLELSEAARGWLADKGYDPAMGARPLARVIHEHVKKPLSRAILFTIPVTGAHVVVDLIGDKIELAIKNTEVEQTPEAA